MELAALTALAETKIENSTGSLKDFQAKHLSQFKNSGFTPEDGEFYKFTKMPSFLNEFSFGPKETLPLEIQDYIDPTTPTFLFLDGEFLDTKIDVPGISYKSLKENFSEVKDLFSFNDAATNFHHSLLNEGLIIDIAKNVVLDQPLRVLYLNTRSNFFTPTIILRAGTNSEATLLEESFGIETEYGIMSETYINCSQGSKIEHIQIEQGKDKSIHHGATHSALAKDASYSNFIFHLGGKLNRKNLSMTLNESGANAESYALFLTDQTEHSDISTVIHHKAADTTSNQVAKGILDGSSKGIFTGKIHIHHDAQRVASGQLNKNLILSGKAQVHSQPQLEIFADDVKCSHGSTTGQLSDEEVFYFQTRGIPTDKAKSLLAYGFGLDVVLKIKNKKAKSVVETIIKDKLKNKFNLGGEL